MMSTLGHVSASSLVEKATSHLLIGPDWAMNMEICDMINTNRWQTKEVVRAIRKRLQNKHSNVQFLAMTLLETMMKNCNESVRFEVAEHEVLPEMVKIVRKQTDFQVREKALILLDSWQEAFGGPGGQHPQYYWAYIELKRSGVQFPRRAPDAPLTFGNGTSSSSHLSAQPYASGFASNSQTPGGPAVVQVSMSELHNMRSAMELLSEMLRAVNPRDRAAIKDEVITDLVSQCKSSQNKIVQLINSTGDEQVLAEALTINDSLQNVIAKYDAIASGILPPEPAPVVPSPVAPPPVAPPPVASAPVVETKFEEDEDDEFAQIAQRKSKGKGVEQEATSSQSDVTVEESVASNALVVIDQPPPTEASKPQDMIDLLTLALYDPNPTSSDNSTPQPSTTSPTSTTTVDPNPWALVPVSSPASPPSPQPLPQTYYPYNQGYNYNPYNNYVASWAQPVAQPTQTQYYPSNPYAFPSTQYQVPPAPTPAPAPAYAPMQRFNSFGGAAGASNATASPVTAIPASSSSGGYPMNVSQPALKKDMPAGSKPYYMPDNLFGDLIDVKSFGAGNKVSNRGSSSMTSSPGKPMVNGKK
ncbi:hypothetical protein LUZ61_006859 [Rhynchospora tenuis]|uniref:Uncharacterized protein n=1 Tax=Rhynchospora tenuis TaxID=198213 RepID=A0AAD5ZSM0_9POAL|nr:hypothetical protein LUZ61_006859 [Rhynchospora tenuis]